MKIYFVILHYQSLEETIACIESIQRNYNNVNIVIIDNNSPNGSGKKLLNKYNNINNIVVLLLDNNYGFAKGNNIGYQYAKKKGADFIIQVNNDTIFDDQGFIYTLIMLYEKEQYAVLGPDVICLKDGRHQNPMNGFKINKKNIFWKIIKNQIGYALSIFNLDNKIKKESIYQPDWKEFINISNTPDKVLQGCCYIFSRKYIDALDGMFEGTFMYYEEYILDYICRKKSLKMVYSPKLSLKHLRKAATTSIVKREKEKRQFKYKHSIKSLKAFYRKYL